MQFLSHPHATGSGHPRILLPYCSTCGNSSGATNPNSCVASRPRSAVPNLSFRKTTRMVLEPGSRSFRSGARQYLVCVRMFVVRLEPHGERRWFPMSLLDDDFTGRIVGGSLGRRKERTARQSAQAVRGRDCDAKRWFRPPQTKLAYLQRCDGTSNLDNPSTRFRHRDRAGAIKVQAIRLKLE